MRLLHVAALPYPSPQGTQGLIHAMLSALAAAGHEAHLLAYAHGAPKAPDASTPYELHRAVTRRPGRSLRSGPSLEKLRLDVGLARALRALERRVAPRAVIAHHVEAALCALAVCRAPVVFLAHTSLRHELPTYFPPALALPLAHAGAMLDARLTRRAACTLAVSPALAAQLAADSGRPVASLPLPWPLPAPIDDAERRDARAALGIAPSAEVALYAGNFDAYQGLEPMLDGIAALALERAQVCLLLASEAELPARMRRVLRGVRVVHAPLADECARRRVHAAADVALVPRRSLGGVPIKLLDALVRGVPVLGPERALAGLPLAAHRSLVSSDTGRAWCVALHTLLGDPESARARAAGGRAEAAMLFAPSAHVRILAETIARIA